MKLCFSTFASILVKCKARSTTQVGLGRAILNTLHPDYEGDYSDTTISDLVHGKKNLPDPDVDDAKNCDPKEIADRFRANVLPLLDNNKKSNIVLAIKDIISQDSSIAGDTRIELVNGMTKAAFCERDTYVFPEVLAGIFLYILLYTNNSGTRADADLVTNDLIAGYDGQTDVSFIETYSDVAALDTKALPIDTHLAALIVEAEGKCIRCGRPLAIENGSAVNRGRIITLPDHRELVVCADCECVIASMNDDDKIALADRQLAAQALNSARDDISLDKLDGDIEAVLRAVHDLKTEDDAVLRLDPLAVDRKITDNRLKSRVRGDVLTSYKGVNDVIDRLSGEHLIEPTRFARQIRRVFEDADAQGLSQRQIYDLLTEKLDVLSGRHYKTACEVIVSYFIQRCEVFNEIAE